MNLMSRPEELLEGVRDQASFIAFVQALAADRTNAAEGEREQPDRFVVDGANNWKNSTIQSFLWAALDYFEPGPEHKPESFPSWRMFAEFLWCGKIIE